MTTHMTPVARSASLLHAAAELAKKHGYQNVTREQIAKAAGVSEALVSHHLGTMPNMRRALVRHAIANNILIVIGQAIAARDPHVRKVDAKLKMIALASL